MPQPTKTVDPRLRALGTRIRHLREDRGLSAEAVAERAGMSARGLIYIEHGKRNPSALTLLAISGALNVPVGELFDHP